MKSILVPFRISATGAVASTTDIDVIARQEILDVLVTGPFERIMRPRHGAGLNALIFDLADPNELADMALVARDRCAEQISICIVKQILVEPYSFPESAGRLAYNPTAIKVTALYQIPPENDNRTAVFTISGLITEES